MSPTELNKQFQEGTFPKNCEGFYKGELLILLPESVAERLGGFFSMFWLPWKGKVFYSEKSSGDNIITTTGGTFVRALYPKTLGKEEFGGIHAFPFTTSKSKGLENDIEVLRLSYDLPENPERLRTVIDEVVEVGVGKLLGKAFLKEDNDYRLAAYFRLYK